jgi:hypothetical protein
MIYIVIFLLMGAAAWVSYDMGNNETKTPE